MLLGASVLAWLFHRVSPASVLIQLERAQLLQVLVASVFVILSYVCRAVMWKRLLSRSHDYSYGSLFRSMMIGYLVNNLVPARLGDVVRGVWLCRLRIGSKSSIFGSLVLERTLDVSVVLALLCFGIVTLGVWDKWLITALALFSILLVLAIVGGTLLSRARNADSPFWARSVQLTTLLPGAGRILSELPAVVKGLHQAFNLTSAVRAFPWLLATWIITYLGLYFTLASMHLTGALGLAGIAIVLGLTGIGLAIPSLPASLGAYQAAFMFGASLVGLSESRGLAASILYQGLWVLITSVLGIMSLAWDGVLSREPTVWRRALEPLSANIE